MKYATVYEITVSVGSVDTVRSFRIIAEMAGWTVTRHEGKRPVHRMAIIIPLQQSVRTFGIVIDNGPLEGAAMQAWSHTPTLQERLLQNGFFPKQSMKTCGMIHPSMVCRFT